MNKHREALVEILGGFICKNCSIDDERVLQIDHVYSNGKEMPLSNASIIQYYIENPDIAYEELQVLCCNCHRIKTLESGVLGRRPGKKYYTNEEYFNDYPNERI